VKTSEAITHMIWLLEKKPKLFEHFRDRFIDLRVAIVNAEIRHRESNVEECNGRTD
jgi:hypothetical protein